MTRPTKKITADSGLVVPVNWTFCSSNVADNFDTHVREQLPWYGLATATVAHLGRNYLPEQGRMYDFGASTGNITRALDDVIMRRDVEAISVDNSPQMVEVWNGVGSIVGADISKFEIDPYDFGVCFLTLMFLSPELQYATYARMYDALRPGGALVVFDKTADYNSYLSTVMHSLTLAGKVATGVDSDAIVKKELSLGGVQRPLCSRKLLATVPVTQEIFRFGEFVGWVATK